MATVSSTTLINQPVDKVFNYVVSVENHKAWQEGIQEATVTPAPLGVGSTYTYTSKVMGRTMQTQMQVSAFEPNRRWHVKTAGPNSVETAYVFEPAGNGTKLTITMELSGGFPAAAEGMIKQQMQKSLDEQGGRVKRLVGG